MGVKQTEALKLALKKAFDLGKRYWSWADSEYSSHWKKADAAKEQFNQLVEDTIREALADHSTNRPISRLDAYPKEQVAAAKEDVLSAVERHGLSEQPAQQEQVAWPCVIAEADFEKDTITLEMQCSDYMVRAGQHWLSTSPQPSKPWVGLTNQELIDLTAIYSGAPLYCAIEAKLREKNT